MKVPRFTLVDRPQHIDMLLCFSELTDIAKSQEKRKGVSLMLTPGKLRTENHLPRTHD